MSKSKKIAAICLFSILALNILLGENYYGRVRSYPLPKTTMERLGESALRLAKQKLAKNSKDPKGLLLLNFANHLIPTNREVLLIRGKLKFKVSLKPPKKKVDEKEFITLLAQARDHVNDSDTAMNRHILAVLNQLIRSFNPKEEDAIITLMKFSDKDVEIDIDTLLQKKLDSITDTKFDPKDSRYTISNVKKTVTIPANTPWTDTWIKIKAGKMIRVTAHGTWSMGDEVDFPVCDPDGYTAYDIKTLKRWSADRKKKKKKKTASSAYAKAKRSGAPGCLLAKIGNKEYYIGRQMTFKAESNGVLYFGPYEWGDYLNNYGSLTLNIEIYD